jgi:hypothetical protein
MSSAHDQPPRDTAAGAPQAAPPPPGGGAAQVPRPAPHYEGAGHRESTGHSSTGRPAARPSRAAMGVTVFAAMFMMLSGLWSFFEGLAAIIRGSYFVVLPNYAFHLSVTGWGWFHLILGIVMFGAGCALFTDALWARVVAVCLAGLSALTNFLFIPYAPAWSIMLIAVDAVVIWALVSPRRGWA